MRHAKATTLEDPGRALAGAVVGVGTVAGGLATGASGTAVYHNGDGTVTVIGTAAGDHTMATHVGDTTPPPVPTGIAASSVDGTVTVTWDGTLAGEVPPDFHRVNLYVDGTWFAALTEAGSCTATSVEVGSTVEVTATSEDDACLYDGTPAHNVSDPCDPVTVEVSDLVAEGAAMAEEARGAAEALKATAATKTEVSQAVDAAKGEVLTTVAAGYVDKATGETLATKAELSQTADSVRSDVASEYATKDSTASLADKSYVDQTASSITAAVESEYLKKGDAESSYATKAEVKVEADRITQSVEAAASDAASAVEKASTVEQTAEGLKVTVSGAVERVDGMEAAVGDAAKTATSFLRFDAGGLTVGDMTGSALGKNVLIDSDSIDIRDGSSTVAAFEKERVRLGIDSDHGTVEFVGGKGAMAYYSGSGLRIAGDTGVDLRIKGATERNPCVTLANVGSASDPSYSLAVSADTVYLSDSREAMGGEYDVRFEAQMYQLIDMLNGLADSGWRTINSGGWTVYYRKVGKAVQISGKSPSTTSTGWATCPTKLPEGFRPVLPGNAAVSGSAYSVDAVGNNVCRFFIHQDGTVQAAHYGSANTYVDFSAFYFA